MPCVTGSGLAEQTSTSKVHSNYLQIDLNELINNETAQDNRFHFKDYSTIEFYVLPSPYNTLFHLFFFIN